MSWPRAGRSYQLLNIDRGVPETFASSYDIRTLLSATSALRDHKKIKVPAPAPVREAFLDKLDGNEAGRLLERAGLI